MSKFILEKSNSPFLMINKLYARLNVVSQFIELQIQYTSN